ncbi:NADPH dehydrogenase [Starmerella bacillaris]|uniref:NADPH dehydrogenase n=1 Tax=Starmerella bacillaris TaxID=1247836 RepID=A0AAV5RKS2_STABA|nr:NADPH dehydrogenase [Starmerella bacillaris]
MPSLFDPIEYGSIKASNRVVMAPLTRARATRDAVPTDIMIKYYEERASIGMIISEATGISRTAVGWAYAPGIWSKEQVEAWKPITKAVHAKGGKIVCQLWHMGRAVHSQVTGSQPVSCSPTKNPGHMHTFDGKAEPELAHELTIDEIKGVINDYKVAAQNALDAGFDGVQIHAANGYLIHQFIGDDTNLRTDKYGGSLENKLRFLKEVVDAVVDTVGPERTGIRFSPNGPSQGVFVKDNEHVYLEIAKFLNEKNIAFVGLRESSAKSTFWDTTTQPKIGKQFAKVFKGKLILNQEYTREEAIKAVEEGDADAISFGRATITNPDIVDKLKNNIPFVVRDDTVKYLYSQGVEGYTTWP